VDETAFEANPLRQVVHQAQDPQLVPEHVLRLYDQGRAFAAQRALKKVARKETDEVRRAMQEDLIARKRLWLQPMSSTPTLFTFNTLGTVMSGRHQPDAEGFYVKTLFLSALFLPLVPLASYVVQDADDGGWIFYAKAPMPPLPRLQQLALAGLVGLGVLGGVASAAWSSAHSQLIVVNGFDRVLEVEVDGRVVPVDPHSFVLLPTTIWQDVHVRARLLGPDVLVEELDVAGADWGESTVYNPGSRALLTQGWVRWGEGDPPEARTLWDGPVSHVPHVDYVFQEPEETRWLDEDSYEESTWLDWSWEDAGHDPANELRTLASYEAFPFASLHARSVLHDHPDSELAYLAAWPLLHDAPAIMEEQVATYPRAVHAHRMLHGTLEPEVARARYKALADEHPDDAMYAYLYGRLLDDEPSERWFRRALELDPGLAEAHRGLLFNRWYAGDLQSAAAHAERLAELDPESASLGQERAVRAGLALGWDGERLLQAAGERQTGFDLATRVELMAHPDRADALAHEIDAAWRDGGWQGSFDVARVGAAWYAGDDAFVATRLQDAEPSPGLVQVALLHALSTGQEAWFMERYETHRDGVSYASTPLLYLAAVRAGREPDLALELVPDESVRAWLGPPTAEITTELARAEPGVAGPIAWVHLQLGEHDPQTQEALQSIVRTSLPWELPRSPDPSEAG